MPSTRSASGLRWLAATLCVFLCSCNDAPSDSPIKSQDTTSHNTVWKVDTLGTYGSGLLDICAVSPSSVYAVGAVWDASGTVPTFVMHWDGVKWNEMRDDSLRFWISGGVPGSVHALADTVLFIAGTRFVTRDPLPMAAYWNGKKWRNISPNTTHPLTGIWAKSLTEIYVVGTQGLIMRYDGSVWHSVVSPTQLDYHGIWGLPTGELYAVACDDFDSYKGSVLVRIEKDGAAVEFSRTIGRLLGIGGSISTDLFAVGDGVFHRGSDGAWLEIAMPGTRVAMRGVFSRETNDVLIVGAFGKTTHWSGRTWRAYDELYDGSSTTWYYHASAGGGRYFLVGGTGTRALLGVGVPR